MASAVYPEAEGDSLRFIDDTDRGGDYAIAFVARNGRAAQLAGPVAVLSLPFMGRGPDYKPIIQELQSHTPCRHTFDAAEVPPAGKNMGVIRFELPDGWLSQLPKNVKLAGPLGDLEISYSQTGRELTISQREAPGSGVLPAEQLSEVIAWLQQLSQQTRDAHTILLTRTQTTSSHP